MLARSEIGLGGRATLIDNQPFSAGAFANLWWGSKLLDDSKRNGFTADLGAMVSLTALTGVTITGRAYVELWTDRHCPTLDKSMPNGFDGDPIDICVKAKNTLDGNGNNNRLSAEETARLNKLIGTSGSGVFDRENGARFLLSLIGEIALQQEWSLYIILEGAPFQQSERALFTSMFAAPMGDTDYRIYTRVGLTYKF